MKKSLFIICLLLPSLTAYSQDCDDYALQYEQFKAYYNKAKLLKDKKHWIRQMELTLNDAKELHCGIAKEKKLELQRLKKSLNDSRDKDNNVLPTTFTINADGDPINVKYKKGIQILGTSIPDWLKVQEADDNKTYEFSADRNFSPHNRAAIIEVEEGKKHHQITIMQEAAPLQANVTEHIGFGQDGGPAFLFIETNDTAWTVSTGTNGRNWLTTELTDYGAKVTCAANPSKKRRTSKIRIQFACGETRDVDISQAIGRTTLTVPQKQFVFDYNGGKNEKVSVNCNYDQWNASPSVNWLKVRKSYGGISIECSPNSMAATRTGTVKIETNDAEHLVEYIIVRQDEAPAYISALQSQYKGDGDEQIFNVKVKTNIPNANWYATVENGRDWTSVSQSNDYARVYLKRNDCRYARTSTVKLYGKGESYLVSFSQPNRGFAGRYKDYFDAKGGDWHVTWFSIDLQTLTTVGNNISFFNARWKPVELSMLNFNIDYLIEDGISASWEPVIRGFIPISRDGKWAAYAGMGGHVCMTDGLNYFLLELGTEVQWNKKRSSRIFFKYNGGCSLGISFDVGKWIK